MIAVEFRYRKEGDAHGTAGWYALPQVPAIGEGVLFDWTGQVADVVDVQWCFDIVPAGALSMVAAGLASNSRDDKKWLARVYVDLPDTEEEA